MERASQLHFQRVDEEPMLDLSAVPWATGKKTIMVPTVIDMTQYLDDPIDRFYMYYAPHHSKGIGLATAPHPEGPWSPYHENPILTLDHFPSLKGHISAMEVLFQPEKGRFLGYPHGSTTKGKQDTAIGSSEDGVHFAEMPNTPVLSTNPHETWEQHGASYLRIFQYAGMLYGIFKSLRQHGVVRTTDGIHWEYWSRNPLIGPVAQENEFDRIRHTSVLILNDILYMFYSTYTMPDLSRESIKLARWKLSERWEDWGELQRLGVVFEAELPWEESNVRDPSILLHNDSPYMYYVGGNEKGIALARLPYEEFQLFGG